MVIYEGDKDGTFSIWLYELVGQDEESPTRVIRYVSVTDMHEAAARLKRGGRFKRVWLCGYDEESDTWSNAIEDWQEGDD